MEDKGRLEHDRQAALRIRRQYFRAIAGGNASYLHYRATGGGAVCAGHLDPALALALVLASTPVPALNTTLRMPFAFVGTKALHGFISGHGVISGCGLGRAAGTRAGEKRGGRAGKSCFGHLVMHCCDSFIPMSLPRGS